MLDRQTAYAEWAPSYPPSAHNALMQIEQAAMVRLMPALDRARVLDAGSGTGRYARLAMQHGAGSVIQYDDSTAMLTHALRVGSLIRGELSQLPFRDRSFDVILSGLALPDVADLRPVVTEWSRVLRRGGWLLYSTLHPNGERLGWTRTFETRSGHWMLPVYWHTAVEHQRACVDAGLIVERIDEPLNDAGDHVSLVVRASRAE